jgi:hypothetical protein
MEGCVSPFYLLVSRNFRLNVKSCPAGNGR